MTDKEKAEEKKILVEKGIHAGLGTEKFLEGLSFENLKTFIDALEEKDGEIKLLKENQKPKTVKNPKVTRVSDLVAAGKIKVRPVPENEPEEKGGKDGKEKA